ncbi:unnamed protein product [Larinioides sclopetarius]|uniref:Protein kinase domain-containing protein n=1 Tax=Larinioides sclopetarius TaxID=280406 RepID=A0AAV2AII5_9ARAC
MSKFVCLTLILKLCLFALSILLLSILFILLYLRRKSRFCCWVPENRRGDVNALQLRDFTEDCTSNDPRLELNNLHLSCANLELTEEIGEGHVTKLHKGSFKNPDGTLRVVAVKTLKDNANKDDQADFLKEIEILSNFSHANILILLGVVFKENQTCPWIVFEFIEDQNLTDFLRRNRPLSRSQGIAQKRELTQMELIKISSEIANGMSFLSQQNYAHKDLSTRNCFVARYSSIKIAYFGVPRNIHKYDYYEIQDVNILPIRWMSPESLSYGTFSLESDVWAYGVTLWEIFQYGKLPYFGHSNMEVRKLILQGILLHIPENCPAFIHGIMVGCWKIEPKDRLTFADVCRLNRRIGLADTSVAHDTSDRLPYHPY